MAGWRDLWLTSVQDASEVGHSIIIIIIIIIIITRLPGWLYCMISLEVRCEVRWGSWWRNINTRTTLTLDNEWVWLNINWGWVGGGPLPPLQLP